MLRTLYPKLEGKRVHFVARNYFNMLLFATDVQMEGTLG